MSRRLTPKTLDNLRKEAKRWLKALRADDGEARARLERALPGAPADPALRDVQRAIARERGFPGWAVLRNQLAGETPSGLSRDDLVAMFLDNACPDHHVRGGPDHLRARHTAMRLLARDPDIARASFYTAVVCGELREVERRLAERPELASEKSPAPTHDRSGVGGSGDLYRKVGPKGWEPLLYLCFTRLPVAPASENAVPIATALLERGADPNVYFMAGSSRYTPLVGTVGEGEEDRPPHPQRDALVRLLLEHGAEPYDSQVIYDIHFRGSVLWFLQAIYERTVQIGRKADWDDPDWSMLDQGNYGSGARWHLEIAVKKNDVELAAWCLTHGAGPNAAPAPDPRFPKRSLYGEAMRLGHTQIAELLVRYGATPTPVALEGLDAFVAACLRLDRDEVRSRLADHPEYLRAPEPLFEAARRDRADVVALLLDLGTSPEVENARNERALHIAAYSGALRVAELLIERGAQIDPVESNWGNTPLGGAVYAQDVPMIDLLGRLSRDVFELTYAGKRERLREVLDEEPGRARIVAGGHTPLMWLPPDDERRAMDIARLLMAYGADPALRNQDGMTASERAERLGMFDLAVMLREAAPRPAGLTLERYEEMAEALLDAYRTGTSTAMERHWSLTWHRRSWQGMRTYVQLDLGRRPGGEGGDEDISLGDARLLVAREHGFESWPALVDYVGALPAGTATTRKPVKVFSIEATGTERPPDRSRDWDRIVELLSVHRPAGLDAEGEMTDELLERVSRLDGVMSLQLGGSKQLTDRGLRHLERLPRLEHLDVRGCAITDRGLEVLSRLPELRTVGLAWTGVTDAGAVHLARCQRLERVDLSGTRTGDAAIGALVDKPRLRHVRTGKGVTDAGLPQLHRFPMFKSWQGGGVSMTLLDPSVEPNSLMLRGPFTDKGLASLVGLEGLFGLHVGDGCPAITAAGLGPLASLPHLGWLAFDATDEAMPFIAAMPSLRFLSCQDTTAGDEGFAALSGSRTIEYIWGRRCENLRSRGFRALAAMPALRSLSVSCKNVDDAGLAALPRFPALRELMPIDMPDDGFRHVARCENLESLILMYCRDATDVATERIACLPRLKRYFASYTRITDRSLDILGRMTSLEAIELLGCPGVTPAGVAALARLPRLREVRLSGMQGLTREAAAVFPDTVRVHYAP